MESEDPPSPDRLYSEVTRSPPTKKPARMKPLPKQQTAEVKPITATAVTEDTSSAEDNSGTSNEAEGLPSSSIAHLLEATTDVVAKTKPKRTKRLNSSGKEPRAKRGNQSKADGRAVTNSGSATSNKQNVGTKRTNEVEPEEEPLASQPARQRKKMSPQKKKKSRDQFKAQAEALVQEINDQNFTDNIKTGLIATACELAEIKQTKNRKHFPSGAKRCIDPNCKAKPMLVVREWFDHLKQHKTYFNVVAPMLATMDAISKCPAGCGQYFLMLGNHESACEARVQQASEHLPDTTNGLNCTQWKNDGPHWELLTDEVVAQLLATGIRVSQELRTTRRNSIISFLNFYMCGQHTLGERAQLMAMTLLHGLLLHIEKNKPLDRDVFEKRKLQFITGDWNALIQSVIQTNETNRKLACEVETSMTHVIHSSIQNGNTAIVLDDEQLREVQTEERINTLFQPSQFPTATPKNIQEKNDYTDIHSTKVTKQEVAIALRQCKGVGKTGASIDYWRQTFEARHQPLVKMIQQIVANELPDRVWGALSGTHQVILATKERPDKLRGVGSSDALIKLAGKVLMNRYFKMINKLMVTSPDMAVGKRNGMQHLIHKVKAEWDKAVHGQQEDFAVVALDITGAFPNVNREHLRRAVGKYLPPFLPIFDLLYGRATTHEVQSKDKGIVELVQATGITQGNELSTLFFSIYMKQIFDEQFADLDVMKMTRQYVDDAYLFGPLQQVKPMLDRMKEKFGDYDLKLNPAKCKLWMPLQTQEANQTAANLLDIQAIDVETGLMVLGVPVGKDTWVVSQLAEKAHHYKERLKYLSEQGISLQHRNLFLQNTISYFQHLIAVTPPELTLDFVDKIDKHSQQEYIDMFFDDVTSTLDQTLQDGDSGGMKKHEYLRRRIALPMRFGGMGIQKLKLRYKRAYAISLAKYKEAEKDLSPAMQNRFLQLKQEIPEWSEKSDKVVAKIKISQDCNGIFKQEYQKLIETVPIQQRKIMDASTAQGASNAIKSKPWSKDTTFTDDEFVTVVRHRAGIGLLESVGIRLDSSGAYPKCYACNDDRDLTVEHAFSCRRIKTKQHNRMVDKVVNMVRSAGLRCVKEQTNSDHINEQRMDIEVQYIGSGNYEHTALDFTSTVAYTHNATQLDGHHSRKSMIDSAHAKIDKYRTYAEQTNSEFIPLVMNNHGAIHDLFAAYIDRLAVQARARHYYIPGIDREFSSFWKYTFSCLLMKIYVRDLKHLVHS